MKATIAQIKLIHVLAKKQMDDETYREMLASYGVATSKALSKRLAKEIIDKLQGKPLDPDGPTNKQLALLRSLQAKCGRAGTEGLAWASRIAGRDISDFTQLTKSEASRAIQAALRMAEELEKKELKQATIRDEADE